MAPAPFRFLACVRAGILVGWQVRTWSLFGRSSPRWGRAGPSDAHVMGCHVRSPRISRMYPGECQTISEGDWAAKHEKPITARFARGRNRREVLPKACSLERETGLEPATACLEGRYSLFHRSHAAKPLKIGASRATQLYDINEADTRWIVCPAGNLREVLVKIARSLSHRSLVWWGMPSLTHTAVAYVTTT